MIRRMTVEMLSAGQPRPYADSVYRGIITLEVKMTADQNFKPWNLNDEIVRKEFAQHVHSWTENPQWFESRITKFEKTGEGKWEVVITSPYTD